MEQKIKCNKKAVLKFSGAFIAWVIGSGFATGQEVLQFFTSYGYRSYIIALIVFFGFLFLAEVLLVTGYDHRMEPPFNHFKYFCGQKLGMVYSCLIPVILILMMFVLISGAGATFFQYYGIQHYIGSAFMSIAVLCAYLIGFEKLVKIVSSIGPIIILFLLLMSIITVIKDFDNISQTPKYESILSRMQSSPHWILSPILYLSLNFLGGSMYFTQLGISADTRQEAKYGALLGGFIVMVAIVIINTSILLNAENAATLAIPMLFLAQKISSVFGSIFSIALILGMFSSCSTMMWSVCNRFVIGGKRGNQIFAVCIAIFTFILGLFSFTELIGIVFPLIGYMGLPFVICVIYKGLKQILKPH